MRQSGDPEYRSVVYAGQPAHHRVPEYSLQIPDDPEDSRDPVGVRLLSGPRFRQLPLRADLDYQNPRVALASPHATACNPQDRDYLAAGRRHRRHHHHYSEDDADNCDHSGVNKDPAGNN